jgi:phosphohistidine phosphatase SixA
LRQELTAEQVQLAAILICTNLLAFEDKRGKKGATRAPAKEAELPLCGRQVFRDFDMKLLHKPRKRGATSTYDTKNAKSGRRLIGTNMRTQFSLAMVGLLLSTVAVSLVTTNLHAQSLSGQSLVAALRQGGYVIVMRHASSPREAPDKNIAKPDNINLERQLDESGRETATAMGKALRDLKIPIGEVLSSPTYRALETVRLGQFGTPTPVSELGDGGQSMQAVTENQTMWLREKVTHARPGTNVLFVTHMPNIARAFPDIAGVADGEALIFHPDGKGSAPFVGRIKIEEWPHLRP